jgi:hypothetical protein
MSGTFSGFSQPYDENFRPSILTKVADGTETVLTSTGAGTAVDAIVALIVVRGSTNLSDIATAAGAGYPDPKLHTNMQIGDISLLVGFTRDSNDPWGSMVAPAGWTLEHQRGYSPDASSGWGVAVASKEIIESGSVVPDIFTGLYTPTNGDAIHFEISPA